MHYPIDIATADAPQPILSRAELKDWLGYAAEVYESDDVFDTIIAGVSDFIQADTGQRVFPESRTYRFVCLPGGRRPINIPVTPVNSVTSFTYRDVEGNDQLLAGVQVFGSGRQYLEPALGDTWPQVFPEIAGDNVRIVLSVGYAAVPNWALIAARHMASHWFDLRSGVQNENWGQVPLHIAHLLRQNRIPDHFAEYL